MGKNMIHNMRIVVIISLACISSVVFGMAPQVAKVICYPCVPFKQARTALVKSDLFYASVDPRDARVPRVFVQTHRHIASLSDWEVEHWQEFGKFEKMLELGLKKAFNADLVNVACLMNLAEKEGTHTHWHFIARLSDPFQIFDPETGEKHTFQDPCYGKPYDMNSKNYLSVSDVIMGVIIRKIQESLDLTMLPGAERIEAATL